MFTEAGFEGVCVRVMFVRRPLGPVQGASPLPPLPPLGAGDQVWALLALPTTPTKREEMLGVILGGII